MAVTITPGSVGSDGGYPITVVYDVPTFPPGGALEVFLGVAGDDTDGPCYGGEGLGYFPKSEDGETLVIITPPQDAGSGKILSWRVAGGGAPASIGTVEVIERNFAFLSYQIRRLFPPWASVGARRLELEDIG
jgi:hypothetical protein